MRARQQRAALARAHARQFSRPVWWMDFANDQALDSRITFTNPSNNRAFFGSNGLLQYAAANVARFDFNPTTGICKGLLIEEQRTNLLLWSRDLTNAAWVKTNATAALTATGIDGAANSASTLTATAGNATILQSVTSALAARATAMYVKRRTGTGNIDVTQDGGTLWTTVTINSTTWTRVGPATATVTNPSVGFRIVTSGDAIDVDYCQLESASFSTSAIATTTAQITRSADVASMTGTNFSSWYNPTEGAFVAKYSGVSNVSGATRRAFQVDDGGSTERIIFGFSTTTNSRLLVMDGGVATADIVITSVTTEETMAGAYKLNSVQQATRGTLGTEDTSCTLPTVTTLRLGSDEVGTANTFLNGHLAFLAYYPKRLSNSEIQGLSL